MGRRHWKRGFNQSPIMHKTDHSLIRDLLSGNMPVKAQFQAYPEGSVLKKEARSDYPNTMINPVITLTTISPAVRYPIQM